MCMSVQEHRHRNTSVTVTTVCVHLPAGQSFFSPQSKMNSGNH